MKNVWLKRRGRRRVVDELNRCLKRFVGYSIDPMEQLVAEMRKEVLRYFKAHSDDLKLFVEHGSLDYRFNISHNKGKVVAVEFEPLS
jgi:hypothetical protein